MAENKSVKLIQIGFTPKHKISTSVNIHKKNIQLHSTGRVLNENRESVTPAKIRSGCLPKGVTCHCIVLVRAEPRRQPIILGRLHKASRSTKLQLFSPVTSDILLSCSIFLHAKITSLSIAPPPPLVSVCTPLPAPLSLSISLRSSHVSFTSSL